MSCKDSTIFCWSLSGCCFKFFKLCKEKKCHWVQTDWSGRSRKSAHAPSASLQTWCQQKCQPGVSALKAAIVIAVKAAGVVRAGTFFFFLSPSRSSCRVAPPAAAIDKVTTAESGRVLLLKKVFSLLRTLTFPRNRTRRKTTLFTGAWSSRSKSKDLKRFSPAVISICDWLAGQQKFLLVDLEYTTIGCWLNGMQWGKRVPGGDFRAANSE